ncbi:universal stress protein [Rhodanobacter sp. Si-c]|uniref:Universal stress protein n=1 Tax=Rhodanobacter lycopersici TaxID=3162487 RepID=A0ABV3Q9I4_9GAMM
MHGAHPEFPAKEEHGTGHILVLYDGSPGTDGAVEHALALARQVPARLFVLAVAPTGATPSTRTSLTDDLIAFARLGRRLGVEVDGSCLDEAAHDVVEQVIASHGIDRVVLPGTDSASKSPIADLLRDLGQDCPVPIVFSADPVEGAAS